MASKLKKTEISVLRELEINSRIAFSKIGKKTRMSQQRVSYIVNSLKKRGIIKGFYTGIDYSKLNLIGFRVYFRINYMSEKRFDKLLEFFESHPNTYWVKTCSGRYDLICTFLASNVSLFNKILRSIMEEFPKQLQNYTILTTIVIRLFGKKYLFKDMSKTPQMMIGGDKEPEKLNNIDIKLLKKLSEDARTSSVKLSQELELTPKTIINRIKELKKRNIIKGFRMLVDPREINRTAIILLIKYHNVSTKLENNLVNYLKMHPYVTSLVKTLGEWDIEIMIETEDMIQFKKVEREIRSKFGLLIQNIESLQLEKTYKMTYFPKFLLDNIK